MDEVGIRQASNQGNSIYYNGYIYSCGSWLQSIFDPTYRTYIRGVITKTPINDLSTGISTIIKWDDTVERSAGGLKTLCRIGQMIYSVGYVYSGGSATAINALIQYNTVDDTYKLWNTYLSQAIGVVSDDEYLYVYSTNTVVKYLEEEFRNPAWGQFNIDTKNIFGVNIEVIAIFDSTRSGAYPNDSQKKGNSINTITVDDDYLYVAFTERATAQAALATVEIHKVNKTTMLSEAWSNIPTTSDDTSQNSTHVFLGVKLGTTSGWNYIYGQQWSAVAVDKSTMQVYPLVRHGGTDITGSTAKIYTHGLRVIDDTLFIYKQDYKTYAVPTNSVTSWSSGDTHGSHVSDVISYSVNGTELGSSGTYSRKPSCWNLCPNGDIIATGIYEYSTFDAYSSSIMKFKISGYDFTTPTFTGITANTIGLSTKITADIISTSGVTSVGVRLSHTTADLTDYPATLTGNTFSITLSGLTTGTYYYQIYAINHNGLGESIVYSFSITGNDAIPTVRTRNHLTENFKTTTYGYVEKTNGQTQTQVGFIWGLSGDSLTNTVICSGSTTEFNYAFTNFDLGTYYYKAFADNSIGRGYSDLATFEVTKYLYIDVTDNIINPIVPTSVYIHGSLYYDGYIYGSARNITVPASTIPGHIVKISTTNFTTSGTTRIDFRWVSGDTGILDNMEQLLRSGHYIYLLGGHQTIGGRHSLIQLDTRDDSWKIFKIDSNTSAPILLDDEYLYIMGFTVLNKYRISDFQNPAYPQYNTEVITVPLPTPVASFNHMTFGELFNGYSTSKGYLHCGVVDSNYVWLGFTTGGYDTRYELQKVDKNTMTGVDWCLIPKATDDCTQTSTHVFFGIEVQPGAPSGTFGKGYGTYAVRKSDMRLTALPKYDVYDGTGSTITSYASLLYGDYLLDMKTNGYTYILDIRDVDNWSYSDPVGTAVLSILGYYDRGIRNMGYNDSTTPVSRDKTPNELVLDPSTGMFYSFLWSPGSGIQRFTVPNPPYNFIGTPIVDTIESSTTGSSVTLFGGCLNNNGSPLSNTGFEWGSSELHVSDNIVYTNTTGNTWNTTITGLTTGVYYYRAIAVNESGIGYGTIMSFTLIVTNIRIYLGIVPITTTYLGTTMVSFGTG